MPDILPAMFGRISIIFLSFVMLSQSDGGEVKISQSANGEFSLNRHGKPFEIKGVAGSHFLEQAQKHGANTIRTWGVEALEREVDGTRVIDRCEELGLAVTAGIWIGHARHGFDYSDPVQLEKQRNRVRETVRKFRDHPAMLMWGLGNESEGPGSDGSDPRIWRELDVLARIIKEEDPDHPVMTVIAGFSDTRIKGILEHYPSIDVLGVNAFATAPEVGVSIREAGWEKPFVLSEFGPDGHWEVAKTPWGAPIEPSSHAKAHKYRSTVQRVGSSAGKICLGSYCFYWGQKQETTATWFGMFLDSGEKLPPVDMMSRHWTGRWPENRCPKISAFDSELKNAVVSPGRKFTASIAVEDPDGDPVSVTWTVASESDDTREGGDREAVPPTHPACTISTEGTEAVIQAPLQPGNYRLFGVVRDGKGNACVDNFCFRVE